MAPTTVSPSTVLAAPLNMPPSTSKREDASLPVTASSTMVAGVEEEKVSLREEPQEEWTYPDGGLRAWLVVFGCWCFALSSLSYGLIWGVLVQDLNVRFPSYGLAKLNVIGGIAFFLTNITGFISGRMGDKYGYKRVIALGSIFTTLSIIASALSYNSIPCLFVFQGVCLGISMGLGFPLCMSLPSQWFLRRRGLATGISISGLGFGGAFYAVVVRALLPKIGYRYTLLVWAAINSCASITTLLCVKPRLPPLKPGQPRVRRNWLPDGVWRDPAFYSIAGCALVGVFGYLTPPAYLVIYAQEKVPSLGSTGMRPAIPVVISNIASGFGRILAGKVADEFGPVNALFLSGMMGGLLQVVVWPFATSLASISVFGALYGLTASWMVSLFPVACSQLFGMEGLATIVGFMTLCNAPGSFAGSIIAGAVLEATGRSWRALASFAGATMICGACFLVYVRFSRQPKLFAKF